MLEVRKVRVGDVALQSLRDAAAAYNRREGVRLKAETRPHTGVRSNSEGVRAEPDWTSVHMNLDIKDTQPPGKELLLALMEKPPTEEFSHWEFGTRAGGYMGTGRVNLPEDSLFSFTLTTWSGSEIKVGFHSSQVQGFIQALLYHWFMYKEETPIKTFAATLDGVCEVKAEDGDPDDPFID